MIELRKLTKRYGGAAVVDNVTLTIPEGGVTSIIGANGAGKSTLLCLISRLIPATAGSVRIDGRSISTTPSHELARRLSILRQDNHITVRLTVEDLVAYGRYPHSKGYLNALDAEHIERSLAYLDIVPLRHRFIDELSGGQRQRAFLAMVLCQDTHYVLLDEPLNGLDLRHAVATMKLLRKAADDLGKTVITVLHDLNFASLYSDRLIAMKAGKVLCEGPVEEVVRPQILREIYDLDVEVHDIMGQRIMTYYR